MLVYTVDAGTATADAFSILASWTTIPDSLRPHNSLTMRPPRPVGNRVPSDPFR
jgi:hypothetical protein